MKRFLLFAVTAVALAALPAIADDLTIVSKVTVGKGEPRTATEYLTSEKVLHSNGDNDSIMDLKAGRMTVIDHKKKEYSEFTLEEMAAFMSDMEKQMQGNPIMEKLMGGALGEVSVKKGATPRKIAGYTCDEYIMSMGENMTWEMWTTPDVQPPMQYYDAYKAQFSSMGPMAKRMEKMVDEMRKLKGFPLATTMHMKMMMVSVDTTSEATEVKKGPVPASVFEVPKDYKKKDAPFKAMKH